ncbi:MAG: hypothetical protein GF416_04660 [Candidatus Altiarchaeales archaeon]|nr:hypothetical protein [Candidatus Altiarchaeales archaeon]MBD3416412.1 hypothetical protein [Candidatus Altiarchaeales archaeon]
MDKRLVALAAVIGISSILAYSSGGNPPYPDSYQVRRANALDEVNSLIAEKVESGEYKCCISPVCDMCFMGHWLWDDGICRCDEMIAQRRFDEVCPQCKGDIEEGSCGIGPGAGFTGE